MRFSSQKNFENYFKDCQDFEKQLFTKRSVISSDNKIVKHRKIDRNKFPFYNVCKYGGREYKEKKSKVEEEKQRKSKYIVQLILP